jgi:hypothetical protein
MRKFPLIVLLLLLNLACGGPGPWIKVEGLYESPSQNFSIVVPEGWKKYDTDKYVLITRDDPFLNYVFIQERTIERPFKHTKKKLRRGMLSQEAAEVIIDEISSDQLVIDFEVIQNIPVRISAYEGFKLVFNYRTKDNLSHRTIYYGILTDNYFYNIRYYASGTQHFEKYRDTFEKILNTFKVTEKRPV